MKKNNLRFFLLTLILLLSSCWSSTLESNETASITQAEKEWTQSEISHTQDWQETTINSDTTAETSKTSSVSDAKAAAFAKAIAKKEREKQEINEEKESTSDNSSIFDEEKYIFSYPYKCNLLGWTQYHYPEKDMTYAEVYVGTLKSTVIVRDGLTYNWADMDGLISSATYTKVIPDAKAPDDLPPEALKMIEDLKETAKKTCTRWTLDTSVFNIPTSIDFVDGDRLVELDANNPKDITEIMEMWKSLMPDVSNMTEVELEEFLKKYEQ